MIIFSRGRKMNLASKSGATSLESKSGRCTAPIELWSKWNSEALSLQGLPVVSISKTRLLRKYRVHADQVREIALQANEKPKIEQSLPAKGCNIELTRIADGAEGIWWTLGCEAFGLSLPDVTRNLKLVSWEVFDGKVPLINSGLPASYPSWLMSICSAGLFR
jgi:hypothetical protein